MLQAGKPPVRIEIPKGNSQPLGTKKQNMSNVKTSFSIYFMYIVSIKSEGIHFYKVFQTKNTIYILKQIRSLDRTTYKSALGGDMFLPWRLVQADPQTLKSVFDLQKMGLQHHNHNLAEFLSSKKNRKGCFFLKITRWKENLSINKLVPLTWQVRPFWCCGSVRFREYHSSMLPHKSSIKHHDEDRFSSWMPVINLNHGFSHQSMNDEWPVGRVQEKKICKKTSLHIKEYNDTFIHVMPGHAI